MKSDILSYNVYKKNCYKKILTNAAGKTMVELEDANTLEWVRLRTK